MIKNLAIGGRGNRAMLFLALFLGMLAAVLTVVYLSRAKEEGGGGFSGVVQPVVVAAQDIPARTRIDANMVTVKDLPTGVLLPGVFGKPEEVAGKVTQVPILAGEQVVSSKVTASDVELAQFGNNPPLSLVVPEGMRGFSLKLSEVGSAGGLIRPGDYVDVILSSEVSSGGTVGVATSASVACYVVQDVQVLAVGREVKRTSQAGGSTGATELGASNPDAAAVSATLAVAPGQAWRLAAAQHSVDGAQVGKQLWVSLRPFGEHGDPGGLPGCTIIPGA